MEMAGGCYAPPSKTLGDCHTSFDWGGGPGYCPDILTLVKQALSWALIGVGTVVVIVIVYGAIQYMTAAGDPARAKNGLNTIYGAVLGLLLYLAMLAIVNFIIPGGGFEAG